jgi:hypothetical protein
MNKAKIINDILLEYSLLVEDGGISKVDTDKLLTAIENCGYSQYFSPTTVQNIVEANAKIGSSKHLTDDEIKSFNDMIGPLRRLGNFNDDDLRKIDLSLDYNKPAERFPEDIHMPGGLTYDEMVALITDPEKRKEHGIPEDLDLSFTNCPTRLRLKFGPKLVSRINLPNGLKLGTPGWKSALLYLQLYRSLGDLVRSKTVKASGKEQEKIKADQLNEWFAENNPDKIVFDLHVWDKGEHVNTRVQVDSAKHLNLGIDHKADIGMLRGDREVFWISFKGGDFKEGLTASEIANIDFPQYSGFSGLDEIYDNDKTWLGIKSKVMNGIIKQNPNRIEINPKTTTFDEKGRVVNFNGVPAVEALRNNREMYMLLIGAFKKGFYRLVNDKTTRRKYLYLMNDFDGYVDFLDGSPKTKEIAGKAIYGTEFSLDRSTPFSSKNCNILMQARTPLILSRIPTKSKKNVQLLIRTDENGHVLFNPNLPLPKNAQDPFEKYKPTMYFRSGTNEQLTTKFNGDGYMFMKARIVIVPAAKIDRGAINLTR